MIKVEDNILYPIIQQHATIILHMACVELLKAKECF